MSALLPLMSILEQGGKFLQCVKYACELQGIASGPVRPPLLPMSDDLRREMDEVIASSRDALQRLVD
jgi:4-hydroxy-tetrahydrodipicolinate synthase